MKSIATLTMNPTIDLSYEVDEVRHTLKMRAQNERYAPGGGGINVARVYVRLGGNARCYYLSGGATGPALDGLIDLHELVRVRIPIAGATRIATSVFERQSGREYRFTPQGPHVSESEWQASLDTLAETDCDCMIASGSLPQGVPDDFYVRVARLMADRGIETVLDTSGEALRLGIESGAFLLVKPSLGEFQQLIGRNVTETEDIAREASAIVARGTVKLLAITMGHRGALLATAEGTTFVPAIAIEAKSAVGAGDSFTAAMVHALARGNDPVEAFRFGMAAGSAAVLTPGTGLAYPEDIDRIYSSA